MTISHLGETYDEEQREDRVPSGLLEASLRINSPTYARKRPSCKGIDSSLCTHKILMEDEFKPTVQPQRRVNPNIKEVVKKEVIKLLDVGLIYPISDSPWVSHVHVVPKKGGITVEFDIEIRDKKGAENLADDHLSRLENPDLGKLTKAKIRDLFPEEQLMTISDKSNEPCGPSGGHPGITTMARKVFEARFYWPNNFCNAHKLVRSCDACQRAGNISVREETPQKYIQVSKIFDVWGIDFMGSFPSSNGNKFILVAIDYVSKWVEAQAFPTSDARNVVNFLKRLFAHFGVPKALISDRGTHFFNYQIERAMKRYGVVHRFSTAYHPQINGQACNIDLTKAGVNKFLHINELDELRFDVCESSISYKERTKRWHDKHIKTQINYEKGDKVLLFNSCLRLFPGKLKSRWYGPFTFNKDMKSGAIELCDEEGNEFIVNKQHVKPYQKDMSGFNADDDVIFDDEG
ncbi:reverse transcriptase domain-containing protein [Tanacetum coccineum]